LHCALQVEGLACWDAAVAMTTAAPAAAAVAGEGIGGPLGEPAHCE